ncbi:DUF3102 domain-containing protein [Bacillus thuringiensis]|uniref:DUF3102 domain-containing protein n=1 Tax=Bacillus thuringiensis TaxID=1428 RepID=UPI001FAE6CCF|nr:DUF3102 domain-containing protein [Bacillus thuringiensis]MDM8365812.1 DUF3102 domain-containing protein [Bacillus thuringiensis]
MNELTNLSTDINVITAEIKSYQQIAGQSIFEIGRRLKHVKENDLVHGEWIDWIEKRCNFSRMQANRFIQAYEQFQNVTTSLQTSKIFELIQLPLEVNRQQFIEEPHTIPSTGEEKTVDEMTVRELREVKKALKEKDKLLHQETERRKRAEQEAFAVRKSEQLTRKQLEEFEQQEPQIIEREVVKEVAIESLEHINLINELNNNNKKLKEEIRFYREKEKVMQKNVEDLQQEQDSMDFMANWTVHTLRAELEELIKSCSFSSLQTGAIVNAAPITKEYLRRDIQSIRTLMDRIEQILDHTFVG